MERSQTYTLIINNLMTYLRLYHVSLLEFLECVLLDYTNIIYSCSVLSVILQVNIPANPQSRGLVFIKTVRE